MPWGVAAAGISAAAGLAGSAMQSGAVGKAAGQATRNLELALPQIQQNYDTSINALSPYAGAGTLSVQDQQDLLGLNGQAAADAAMAKFQQSPGYQWQLGQGLRAIDAGAASKGLLGSGATIKAEQTYGQGLANQDFGNYYARLMGLSTLGEHAAGGIATAANNLSSALEGNAASQANVALGAGNAQSSIYGDAAKGIATTANNLFNNTGFQNWLSGGGGGGTVDTGTWTV